MVRLNCVVIVCVDGEDRHRWHRNMTPREVEHLVWCLQSAVATGRCERFLVMYDGAIGVGN